MLRLIRLPRLYRLLRISRLFKMLKNQNSNSMMMRIQELLRLNQAALRLFRIFITIAAICHITAWIWFFVSRIEGFGPDTWVVSSDNLNKTPLFQYITALYWTYATLSTVGYGDISGHTDMERLCWIMLMVFGVCFFSFTIGSMSSIFNRMDSKEAVLNQKM